MSDAITFTIDDQEIHGRPGQTIMQAAEDAGIYIPRLCFHRELAPHGSCRVCTVLVNGRPQAACTQPIGAGMVIENSSEDLLRHRRNIVEMLFVEGNHYCMFCEKSGNCELQAVAYRLGIMAPKFPYQFPAREIDATHPEILIDHNRCILCARCIRASRDLDGKNVFQFINRGPHKKIAVNAEARLRDTAVDVTDKAISVCPVGAILRKRVGYAIPIGRRMYDQKPIGTDVESKRAAPCA
jgi:[NiFe] hydrogenase diaphorase moiety small subunit